MKATLIYHSKVQLLHLENESVAIAELKVWNIPKTEDFPEGIKYSLFLVLKDTGKVLLGFDNHKPKGHHVHIREREERYEFMDVETLVEDFLIMKLKHAKIIIRSESSIKAEWTEALKGKKKSIQKDDELVFSDLESVARIFSKVRMELLQVIINENPSSIYELAKRVGRDFKNVHSDIKLLHDVGLIDLKEINDGRKLLQPIAKFSGIDVDLAA